MRAAVVLRSDDSSSSEGEPDVASRALRWLEGALAAMGFQVHVVAQPEDLSPLLGALGPDDAVLVHVGGRLARRGVLRAAGGRWMPIRALGEALAGHATGDVTVVAELAQTADDDLDDPLVAADHVASVVAALGARERGYAVVVAVRAPSADVEDLAFTRLLLDVAGSSPRADAHLGAVYERAVAMPEAAGLARSFTLVRGRSELDLAPPAPPQDLDSEVDVATAASEWSRAVELRRERLAGLTSPRQRARELVAIGRILQGELGDVQGAIEAFEEARGLEPRRRAVLEPLRRAYEAAGRWASAIEATGALADVTPMPVDRATLRYEQAMMAIDHLKDDEWGVAWLEQALEDDPSHREARAALALVRSSMVPPPPDPVAEPEEPEPHHDPEPPAEPLTDPLDLGDELDPATHFEDFARRTAEGQLDGALLSAMALEELGAAGPEHRALLQQRRSVGPLRVRERLDHDGWGLLRPEGMDDVLGAIFAAVARPAGLARVEQLEARGRLVPLDPGARLDEASTASVVRSFQWAARVLGTPCPDLYVMPEVPGEIAAVRAATASTAVDPSIASGRSAKDLAFLAGRHLTYYRAEHQVLVSFPTRDELTRLLLASVQLTKPDVPATGEGSRAVAALASRIERLATPEEIAELRRAVWELEVRGGKFSLSAWTRAVELLAARVGLLLCGDLTTAMAIVANESRAIAGLGLELRRRDLVGFCVSDEHVTLRAKLTTSPSARPPAP